MEQGFLADSLAYAFRHGLFHRLFHRFQRAPHRGDLVCWSPRPAPKTEPKGSLQPAAAFPPAFVAEGLRAAPVAR
jgi:hypothetical protein